MFIKALLNNISGKLTFKTETTVTIIPRTGWAFWNPDPYIYIEKKKAHYKSKISNVYIY